MLSQKQILVGVVVFFSACWCTAQTVYGTFNSATKTTTLTVSAELVSQNLLAELEDPNAVISDIELLPFPDYKKFLLVASVKNSKEGISSIGIELQLSPDGNIYSGPGYPPSARPPEKHTCKGNPCSSCRLIIINGTTGCRCYGDCPRPPCHCDHSVSN